MTSTKEGNLGQTVTGVILLVPTISQRLKSVTAERGGNPVSVGHKLPSCVDVIVEEILVS